MHVTELDRLLLEWLKLCGATSSLEEARVFQEDRENDQHDWEWIRNGKRRVDVNVQKPPRPAKTTNRTMRMVREPLAEREDE